MLQMDCTWKCVASLQDVAFQMTDDHLQEPLRRRRPVLELKTIIQISNSLLTFTKVSSWKMSGKSNKILNECNSIKNLEQLCSNDCNHPKSTLYICAFMYSILHSEICKIIVL